MSPINLPGTNLVFTELKKKKIQKHGTTQMKCFEKEVKYFIIKSHNKIITQIKCFKKEVKYFVTKWMNSNINF